MARPLTSEIAGEEGLKIVVRQVVPTLTAVAASFFGLHPEWALLLNFAAPLMGAWGEFGQARISEQLEFIAKHKDEFVKEIVEGDDFKTLFLNVLERHMREASKERRELLRNYLLNVGKGVLPDFNEYTRMNNVMDNITLHEIDLLKLWDALGPVDVWHKTNPHVTYRMTATVSDLRTYALGMNPRDEHTISMLSDENKNKNNQALLMLGYKGLVYALAEDNFGSGQEVKVKDITDFGRAFLAFIKEQTS